MIQMLRCPKCYSALTIASQVMCDSCKQVYFVHDGVLFLTDAATSDPRSPTEFMTYDLKDFLQNKRIFGKTITSGVDYAVKEHSLHIFPDKMLSAIGPLCAGKHILDVGSGASPYLSTSISKHKPASYTALDAQFELLRVGRKNSGGGGGENHFVKYDLACALPVFDNSVDVLLCMEVLEHVDTPQKLLADLFRILKPGGVALISIPNVAIYLYPHKLLRCILSIAKSMVFLNFKKARQTFQDYKKHISPETCWQEALEWHPGLRPKIFRRWLTDAGFSIQRHNTLVYYAVDGDPIYKLAKWLENHSFNVASLYRKFINTVNNFMFAGYPVFKWAGIRQFAICKK